MITIDETLITGGLDAINELLKHDFQVKGDVGMYENYETCSKCDRGYWSSPDIRAPEWTTKLCKGVQPYKVGDCHGS